MVLCNNELAVRNKVCLKMSKGLLKCFGGAIKRVYSLSVCPSTRDLTDNFLSSLRHNCTTLMQLNKLGHVVLR